MSTPMDQQVEHVVLLDEAGQALGTAEKATVHGSDTPLHLAFSCHVFDPDGRVLLTQRALDKLTWPGVWTNTLCGHPALGEALVDAVRRRAWQELGLELGELRLALPAFRYRAQMSNGTVENELCPVVVARTASTPRPDPSEVADLTWWNWGGLRRSVATGEREVSPWCVDQLEQLGEDPWRAGDADLGRLPPALRWV